MAEEIEVSGLDELRRLSRELEKVKDELGLNTLGDVAGELEQAVDRVLGKLDDFASFLGLDPSNPFHQRRQEQIDQALRSLQGGLAGFEQGVRLSAFVKNPLIRAASALGGAGIGGGLAFTENDRRADVARAKVDIRNFAAQQRIEREALAREQEARRAAVTRAVRSP